MFCHVFFSSHLTKLHRSLTHIHSIIFFNYNYWMGKTMNEYESKRKWSPYVLHHSTALWDAIIRATWHSLNRWSPKNCANTLKFAPSRCLINWTDKISFTSICYSINYHTACAMWHVSFPCEWNFLFAGREFLKYPYCIYMHVLIREQTTKIRHHTAKLKTFCIFVVSLDREPRMTIAQIRCINCCSIWVLFFSLYRSFVSNREKKQKLNMLCSEISRVISMNGCEHIRNVFW